MCLLLGQRSSGLAGQPAGPSSGLHAGFAHSLRFRASRQVAAWSSARNLHSARLTAPTAVARDVAKPPAPEEGTKKVPKTKDLPAVPAVHINVLDTSVDYLTSLIQKGAINMRPAYQRGLVWDKVKASKLVVTVLENRVVPTIYLEEVEPTKEHPFQKYLVLDGKQRLGSLYAFMMGRRCKAALSGKDGKWAGAPTVLSVKEDLEVSSCSKEYNGINFQNLSISKQRDIERFPIKVIVIGKGTSRDMMLKILEDLNSCSADHSMQQSRQAVYWGPYMELLEELAYVKQFMQIRNPNKLTADNKLQTDRELILRFFALWRSSETYEAPMGSFLNKEIDTYRNISPMECQELRDMFEATAEAVWDIWDTAACRDPTTDSTELIPGLFDAVMVAVCKELHPPGMKKCGQRQQELRNSADKLKRAYDELLCDPTFRDYMHSSKRAAVKERILMFQEMLQRVAPPQGNKLELPQQQVEQVQWPQLVQPQPRGRAPWDDPRVALRYSTARNTLEQQQETKTVQQQQQQQQQQQEGPQQGQSQARGRAPWDRPRVAIWDSTVGDNLETKKVQQQQQQQEGPQQGQPEQQPGNGAVSSSASSSAATRRRDRRPKK